MKFLIASLDGVPWKRPTEWSVEDTAAMIATVGKLPGNKWDKGLGWGVDCSAAQLGDGKFCLPVLRAHKEKPEGLDWSLCLLCCVSGVEEMNVEQLPGYLQSVPAARHSTNIAVIGDSYIVFKPNTLEIDCIGAR